MSEFVSLPARVFTDRQFKPTHIRVLAAIVMLRARGCDSVLADDIRRESAVDRSDVYRAIKDLIAFGLIDNETLFPLWKCGENPTSKQSGTSGAKTSVGKSPYPDLPPIPPPLPSPRPLTNTPPIPPTVLSVARAQRTRAEFDQWWPHYRHKVGKPEALKAFLKVSPEISLDFLIARTDRYFERLAQPNAPNPCNPATWLNQARWDDEPMDGGNRNGKHNASFPGRPGPLTSAERDDCVRRAVSGERDTFGIDLFAAGGGFARAG